LIRQCLDDLPRRFRMLMTTLVELYHRCAPVMDRVDAATPDGAAEVEGMREDEHEESKAGPNRGAASMYAAAMVYVVGRLQLTVSKGHFELVRELLTEAPDMPKGALLAIRRNVENLKAVEHGLNMLKTVAVLRRGPSRVRLFAAKQVLSLASHPEKSIRDKIVNLVVKGLWIHEELAPVVEDKASRMLDQLELGFRSEEMLVLRRKKMLSDHRAKGGRGQPANLKDGADDDEEQEPLFGMEDEEEAEEEEEFRAEQGTVQWYLDLPAAMSCRAPELFARVFDLYGTVAAAAKESQAAKQAAKEARDAAENATKQAQVKVRGASIGGSVSDEVRQAVEAAEQAKLAAADAEATQVAVGCPSAVAVATAIDATLPRFVSFAARQFGKTKLLEIVSDVAEGATPLIQRMCGELAKGEIMSTLNPAAVQLYEAAACLREKRTNIRFVVPFLGAAPKNQLIAILVQLMPWTDQDREDKAMQEELKAQVSITGSPLNPKEFDQALSYLVLSAGRAGSDAAARMGMDLLSTIIGLGEKTDMAPAFVKAMNTAVSVMTRSKAIGPAVIQRAMEELAMRRPLPRLLPQLLDNAVYHNPGLGQFLCTRIMPLLVANEVWRNKEGWERFILLAKRFAIPRPPNCLGTLLDLPARQLREFLGVAPDAKPALGDLARARMVQGGVAAVKPHVREALGVEAG